jgi:hypothetical protein
MDTGPSDGPPAESRAARIIAWLHDHWRELETQDKVQLTIHCAGTTIRPEVSKFYATLAPQTREA